jgi:hypothetical protein
MEPIDRAYGREHDGQREVAPEKRGPDAPSDNTAKEPWSKSDPSECGAISTECGLGLCSSAHVVPEITSKFRASRFYDRVDRGELFGDTQVGSSYNSIWLRHWSIFLDG